VIVNFQGAQPHGQEIRKGGAEMMREKFDFFSFLRLIECCAAAGPANGHCNLSNSADFAHRAHSSESSKYYHIACRAPQFLLQVPFRNRSR